MTSQNSHKFLARECGRRRKAQGVARSAEPWVSAPKLTQSRGASDRSLPSMYAAHLRGLAVLTTSKPSAHALGFMPSPASAG